jgi:hypothetical protein
MMHFKAVFRAAKALRAARLAALRFNFRGVGRSEGVLGNGIGETAEAYVEGNSPPPLPSPKPAKTSQPRNPRQICRSKCL